MIAFAGVVVDHIQPHFDIGLVAGAHQRAEFVVRVAAGIGVVRGEEVERHVAPVVALLRIELVDGHQLDHGHAQLLQIRNLLDESGKGAALVRRDAGVRSGGEALDVQLVHDGVMRVARARIAAPIERRPLRRQNAQRRAARRGAGQRAGVAIVIGREEDLARKRIEQNFGGIEAQAVLRRVRPVDAIGVVFGVAGQIERHPAVPHAPGLIDAIIEAVFVDRIDEVVLVVEQQRHVRRVARIQRKVVSPKILDARGAQRRRRAVAFLPRIDRSQIAAFNVHEFPYVLRITLYASATTCPACRSTSHARARLYPFTSK